jgi:hypothetical protein
MNDLRHIPAHVKICINVRERQSESPHLLLASIIFVYCAVVTFTCNFRWIQIGHCEFFFKSSIGKLPRQQPIWSFIFPLFRAVWTKSYFDRSPSISTCRYTSLPRLIVGVNNFSVIAREKILACIIIIPYTNGKTQTWREKDKETTSTQ